MQMRPYVDALLNVTAELREVFNNLEGQGKFDMKKAKAMDFAAGS